MHVEIEFCVVCNYLPQALSLADRLFEAFGQQISNITLVPTTDGEFDVRFDGELAHAIRDDLPDEQALIEQARLALERRRHQG